MEENVAFCTECGTKITENDDFCPNCGQNLKSRNYNFKNIFITMFYVVVCGIIPVCVLIWVFYLDNYFKEEGMTINAMFGMQMQSYCFQIVISIIALLILWILLAHVNIVSNKLKNITDRLDKIEHKNTTEE